MNKNEIRGWNNLNVNIVELELLIGGFNKYHNTFTPDEVDTIQDHFEQAWLIIRKKLSDENNK